MLDKQNKALMLPRPFRGMGVPRGGGASPDWGSLHARAEAGWIACQSRGREVACQSKAGNRCAGGGAAWSKGRVDHMLEQRRRSFMPGQRQATGVQVVCSHLMVLPTQAEVGYCMPEQRQDGLHA